MEPRLGLRPPMTAPPPMECEVCGGSPPRRRGRVASRRCLRCGRLLCRWHAMVHQHRQLYVVEQGLETVWNPSPWLAPLFAAVSGLALAATLRGLAWPWYLGLPAGLLAWGALQITAVAACRAVEARIRQSRNAKAQGTVRVLFFELGGKEFAVDLRNDIALLRLLGERYETYPVDPSLGRDYAASLRLQAPEGLGKPWLGLLEVDGRAVLPVVDASSFSSEAGRPAVLARQYLVGVAYLGNERRRWAIAVGGRLRVERMKLEDREWFPLISPGDEITDQDWERVPLHNS